MKFEIPEISEAERTRLVVALLDIIRQLQERVLMLEDEIAQLKGLKPRPQLSPSRLEQSQPGGQAVPGSDASKRPGSEKRPKNAKLTIHREVILRVQVPAGSTFKGYEDFVVQDLVIHAQNTRYRRERWLTPDGRTVVADLPADVRPDCHFGPDLICFIIHQYHHQHVTQPLLWEQLQQYGIDISSGQISRILTENKDCFHQEKEELLPTALQVSSYVGVDDTGARHQGRNGYCTNIGNDLFAYFESTDSKSRLNFLEILRRPHTDYVINDMALAYWERQKLPAELVRQLSSGPQEFAGAAWNARLAELGITGERHVRSATEGALLGSLIAHGVSPNLGVLSDGAPQFDVLVHASCWVHAERPLKRLVPYSDQHRAAIENIQDQIWKLYQDLKAYRQRPDPGQMSALTARFDALVDHNTGFPSVDGVLKEMREHKADLLRMLERPEIPLHNNGSESDIRDYVKKRKISGSTRSDLGRRCRDTFASLKKTCRKLGVNFWRYLQDRVRGLRVIPRLAELIRQKAAAVACGGGPAAAPA